MTQILRNVVGSLGALSLAVGTAFAATFSWPPRIIYFDSGSAVVKGEERANVLQALDDGPRLLPGPMYFLIQAHTDSVGTAENNRRLACARARAVRALLISGGASPHRFVLHAFGETRLRFGMQDEEDEPRNRAVEIDYRPLGPAGELPRSYCD